MIIGQHMHNDNPYHGFATLQLVKEMLNKGRRALTQISTWLDDRHSITAEGLARRTPAPPSPPKPTRCTKNSTPGVDPQYLRQLSDSMMQAHNALRAAASRIEQLESETLA